MGGPASTGPLAGQLNGLAAPRGKATALISSLPGIHSDSMESEPAARCPLCGDAVPESEQPLACLDCRTLYHRDCWGYAGSCATYGCGSAEVAPAATLPALSQGAPVHIDATTRAPVPWRLFRQAPGRWLRDRARDLPTTLAQGTLGGLAGAGAALAVCGLAARAPVSWTPFLTLVLAGSAHGLVAPFLAPFQVRAPRTTAAVAVGLFAACMVGGPNFLGIQSLSFGVLVLVASAAATSVSEPGLRWLRARRAQRLPGGLRAAVVWVTSFALWTAGVLSQDGVKALRDPQLFALLGAFALISAVCGAWPLERAKDSYRHQLLEAP